MLYVFYFWFWRKILLYMNEINKSWNIYFEFNMIGKVVFCNDLLLCVCFLKIKLLFEIWFFLVCIEESNFMNCFIVDFFGGILLCGFFSLVIIISVL